MQKNLPYLAIVIVLVYAVYNAKFRDTKAVNTKVPDSKQLNMSNTTSSMS
jgi:hypothetical protein